MKNQKQKRRDSSRPQVGRYANTGTAGALARNAPSGA
jgi:hypothetical protein